jgi:hypothetical protein
MSTAAGPPESIGKSATIEKKATCKWTPVPIPDAREARNSMEATIQQPMSFRRNSRKTHQTGKIFLKKTTLL